MSKLLALAISIAVLGGVWAFLAFGPLAGLVLVWVGFIAWGSYFHSGADDAALQKTIVGMSYGAVIAGIALALVVANPVSLPGALAAPVYIAVTVFLLVIVANIPLLSAVPANVYGYAVTAGYALSKDAAGSTMQADFSNPVLLVILSTIIGSLFAVASAKLSAKLS